MGFYSKEHYRRVSGYPDTPETIRLRAADIESRRLAKLDTDAEFPGLYDRSSIDADVIQEMLRAQNFYEDRRKIHYVRLSQRT